MVKEKVKPQDDENDIDYDPERETEAERRSKFLRLPFALCEQHGIKIQDWWTPKDAWNALKHGGFVEDVDDEHKEYVRKLKKESSKRSYLRAKKHNELKKMQLSNPIHTPDKVFKQGKDYVANAKKGKPMTFEQADSGNVNPFFEDNVNRKAIGYMHNCQTCVACFKARLDGYDVHALPNLNNKAIDKLSEDATLAYIDKTTGQKPVKVKLDKNAMIEGKTYAVSFKYYGKNAGHIITATKVNGKVVYYDPQTNKKTTNLIKEYGSITKTRMFNISDCELNNEFCNKIFKSNKK